MVSLLIPCYNSEKYIGRCLESCINQTHYDIEIIVANDGSTDNTQNIVEEYQLKDKRIKLINQCNKGIAETRNVLINNVNGDFFFFIDADDTIDQNCIETYVNSIGENNLVINSCYVNTKKKEKIFYITNKIKHDTSIDNFLINNTPFVWGILYRTKYFRDNNFSFNGKFPFFEDAGLITWVIYKSQHVSFINNPKYHYFINKGSLCHTRISIEKINNCIEQLNYLYNLISSDIDIDHKKYPQCINDQLAFYHCIIFTYIQFQSSLKKKEKKEFKKKLKDLEKTHCRLKFPKRYWKWWYFLLYRAYGY